MSSIHLLSDSFNTLNLTRWDNSEAYGNVSIVDGKLRINSKTSPVYSGIVTNDTYDLTNGYCFVEIITEGNQDIGSLEFYPLILHGESYLNLLDFYIAGGTLTARKRVSGTTTNVYSTTFSSTNHRYLRLRESGGDIFYEASSDRETWNVLHTEALPIYVDSLSCTILLGTFDSEASTTYIEIGGINYVDNIGIYRSNRNTLPSDIWGFLEETPDYTLYNTEDGQYDHVSGKKLYNIIQFGLNYTGNLTFRWKGKTNLSPSINPVQLEVFNFSSFEWELVAIYETDNITTNFEFYHVFDNHEEYTDNEDTLYIRIYQDNV